MGQVIPPDSGRIYVDANSVIYRVEKLEPYWSLSSPVWDALDEGIVEVVTSELTLLEVLVKPIRDGDTMLINIYRNILKSSRLQCIAIDGSILEEAAKLRADYRLRTPDSIHASTALRSGSVMFLTNDSDFCKIRELNVILLGDAARGYIP